MEVTLGISSTIARFLVRAKRHGTNFGDVITIGRQSLRLVERDIVDLAASINVGPDAAKEALSSNYSELFFQRVLGASSVNSLDASPFEEATVIHDLNRPIPPELKGRFDTLVDSGSIEHIFDLKQTLASYMALVRVGGNIFVCTNANNLCGHGFYQFSPELFYRVFDETNGFAMREMILVEVPYLRVEFGRHPTPRAALDPRRTGKRIPFINGRPTLICFQAEKVSDIEPFAEPVIQSDYDRRWHDDLVAAAQPDPKLKKPHKDKPFRYPRPFNAWRLRREQTRRYSFRNTRLFPPWDFDD
jgi:hypothetical protein